MANYPTSIPTLDTVTTSDPVRAEHFNKANREIEAICLELGTNPRSISPIAPKERPQTIAHYLDMVAYIIWKMHGGANWYNVAAFRQMVGGGGGNGTVAAGATSYLPVFGIGLGASAGPTDMICPYAVTCLEYRIVTRTAQPGSGSLTVQLRNNNVVQTSFNIAAGAAAGVYASGAISIAYSAANRLVVSLVNNAAAASAQIGMFSVEIVQNG